MAELRGWLELVAEPVRPAKSRRDAIQRPKLHDGAILAVIPLQQDRSVVGDPLALVLFPASQGIPVREDVRSDSLRHGLICELQVSPQRVMNVLAEGKDWPSQVLREIPPHEAGGVSAPAVRRPGGHPQGRLHSRCSCREWRPFPTRVVRLPCRLATFTGAANSSAAEGARQEAARRERDRAQLQALQAGPSVEHAAEDPAPVLGLHQRAFKV
mmetsp:Transcript_49478/g.152665  ORF Transcript_49478/g.152665 Transcript_49478/m.152665 type:complete len:213 (+) Transcript_49478:685-1323(+)